MALREAMLATLRPLARRRLLAVDPGGTFTGLAVRTSSLGAEPYGLVEREWEAPRRPGAPPPPRAPPSWVVRRASGGAAAKPH